MLKIMKQKCDKMVMKHENWTPSLMPQLHTQSSAKHIRNEQMALICRFWGCSIIFNTTHSASEFRNTPAGHRSAPRFQSFYHVYWLNVYMYDTKQRSNGFIFYGWYEIECFVRMNAFIRSVCIPSCWYYTFSMFVYIRFNGRYSLCVVVGLTYA